MGKEGHYDSKPELLGSVSGHLYPHEELVATFRFMPIKWKVHVSCCTGVKAYIVKNGGSILTID